MKFLIFVVSGFVLTHLFPIHFQRILCAFSQMLVKERKMVSFQLVNGSSLMENVKSRVRPLDG